MLSCHMVTNYKKCEKDNKYLYISTVRGNYIIQKIQIRRTLTKNHLLTAQEAVQMGHDMSCNPWAPAV